MKKRITHWAFFVALVVGLMTGCRREAPPGTTDVSHTRAQVAVTAPSPQPGLATVAGRFLVESTGAPLEDTVVRLAEVYYADENSDKKGVYVLDDAFSPSAMTDKNGVFVFENVEPKDYVLIVGDIHVHYVVVSNPDNTPKVWKVLPDRVTNVGDITVDY